MKNIINLPSAEFAHSVLSVNCFSVGEIINIYWWFECGSNHNPFLDECQLEIYAALAED